MIIRPNSTHWIAALVILAFLTVLPVAAPRASEEATITPTVTVGTPVAVPTFGPGSFNLAPATGLAALTGYQAALSIDFKGHEDGQDSPWTESFTLLANGKPSARALTATFKGKAPAAAYIPSWSAEMNGVYYRLGADGTCVGSVVDVTSGPNAPMVWEPADLLPGVIGAEAAGNESVNGSSARHYKFDETALGVAGRAKATGEVWVADSGGYVVKYALTLNGGEDYFGKGSDGTLTWAYEMKQTSQPAAIVLPKDCPPGLIDAPVMDNAQDVQRYPAATLYTTSSTVAQVADFYQKKLPAAGWKLDGKPTIGKSGAQITFKQGNSQLIVLITVEDNGTAVRLLLVP